MKQSCIVSLIASLPPWVPMMKNQAVYKQAVYKQCVSTEYNTTME